MQDWKEEVLNWFKIANHTNLDISMQKHFLKIVVDPNMWVKASYSFEAEDSHIEMIDKLCSQFEDSLPLFKEGKKRVLAFCRGQVWPVTPVSALLYMVAVATFKRSAQTQNNTLKRRIVSTHLP